MQRTGKKEEDTLYNSLGALTKQIVFYTFKGAVRCKKSKFLKREIAA